VKAFAASDVTRSFQLVSKFDLAVIVAAIAGGALWIEHRHHVVIDAPASVELAARAPAAACPDNDNVPYSAGCIVFLGSGYLSGMNWQANAAESVPRTGPARISR
jgi:hypothetical protein